MNQTIGFPIHRLKKVRILLRFRAYLETLWSLHRLWAKKRMMSAKAQKYRIDSWRIRNLKKFPDGKCLCRHNRAIRLNINFILLTIILGYYTAGLFAIYALYYTNMHTGARLIRGCQPFILQYTLSLI